MLILACIMLEPTGFVPLFADRTGYVIVRYVKMLKCTYRTHNKYNRYLTIFDGSQERRIPELHTLKNIEGVLKYLFTQSVLAWSGGVAPHPLPRFGRDPRLAQRKSSLNTVYRKR